jgi:ABC-type sugar transport system ATPase subunit
VENRASLLELRGIRKSFGSIEVLRGIDFALRSGETHAVVGHNGAGKSTLMKIIAGVLGDYGGDMSVNGAQVVLQSPKSASDNNIAIIHQDFALVPDLSVAANIGLGREPRRLGGLLISHGKLREQSKSELLEFGIDLPLDKPVRHLGVAGKQMTEIAKALAKRARILIMDEPTSRLAPGERTRLFAIMKRLASTGVGIIYVSHFLDEVKQVADRVTVLRDGAVVVSRPSGELNVDEMAALLVGDHGKTPDSSIQSARREPSGPSALELSRFRVRNRAPINLTIRTGEILGIAGLVGSGRTSLARAILGDLPSTGNISVEGHIVKGLSPRKAAQKGIVMVPEDRKATGLALVASVRANMELTALGTSLSKFGIVRRDARSRAIREGMARFQVRPAEPDRLVSKLSGGNAQKVLLARAASANPKIMLLDQPTAGVDVGAKAETNRQIKALATEGTAVLLISDDLDELLDLSDRISIMIGGTLSAPRPATDFDRTTLLAGISRSVERLSTE